MTNSNHTSISISTGTMVRLLLLLAGVLLLWVLRDMALIIITSIVIASFVESAIPHLAKIGLGRVFGVTILYILALFVFAGLFYLFVPLLITEIYNFSSSMSSFAPEVAFFDYFKSESFSGAKDLVVGLSDNFSFQTLNDVSRAFIDNLSGGLFKTLAVAFGGIFNVFSILLVSFYLSIQEKGIENFLRLIFPLKYENYVVDLWRRSSIKIAFWVKSQMLLGLVVGVLIYLMLSLLGVEYALLLAVIAGLFDLIPYGSLVAVIPALAVSYFSDGFYLVFMVGMAYLIINQFEVFLFAPVIIKKVVGLSPIVIILAVLIGLELASVWGLVLAIPIAVILMELLSDVEKNKTLARTKHESQ